MFTIRAVVVTQLVERLLSTPEGPWFESSDRQKNYINILSLSTVLSRRKRGREWPFKNQCLHLAISWNTLSTKHSFLKMGHSRPLFLYFCLFNTVDSKLWSIKFRLWFRKRLLYQLSHNHCPSTKHSYHSSRLYRSRLSLPIQTGLLSSSEATLSSTEFNLSRRMSGSICTLPETMPFVSGANQIKYTWEQVWQLVLRMLLFAERSYYTQ